MSWRAKHSNNVVGPLICEASVQTTLVLSQGGKIVMMHPAVGNPPTGMGRKDPPKKIKYYKVWGGIKHNPDSDPPPVPTVHQSARPPRIGYYERVGIWKDEFGFPAEIRVRPAAI